MALPIWQPVAAKPAYGPRLRFKHHPALCSLAAVPDQAQGTVLHHPSGADVHVFGIVHRQVQVSSGVCWCKLFRCWQLSVCSAGWADVGILLARLTCCSAAD